MRARASVGRAGVAAHQLHGIGAVPAGGDKAERDEWLERAEAQGRTGRIKVTVPPGIVKEWAQVSQAGQAR